MRPARTLLSTAALAALSATWLAGCSSGPKTLPGDDAPTLASLRDRTVAIVADAAPAEATARIETETLEAYRAFLATPPTALTTPQRAEAQRRLGDLEMDRADRIAADAPGAELPDYRAAIEQYQAFLKTHPGDPRTDRVLYQLARAQEAGGQLEAALATLTQLVQQHPGTLHADEAHFRRGEMLFAMQQWGAAETAFRTVLTGGPASPFTERARYMQGWSLYKLGRLDDALEPFFAVVDGQLGSLPPLLRDETRLEDLPSLTRAERELLEDSFRIVSISLAQLQGAASIPPLVTSASREGWQFRVYDQLAAHYLRQERVKDAADTLAAFVRREPLHAQAPLMQAQVIRIYEEAGFAQLALDAKREHVQRYDANSEFRRANPGGWANAQPLVRQHLIELARHHHARVQQARSTNTAAGADMAEAVRWYDALIAQFPADPATRANRFLLAELLYDDGRFDRAATEFERVAYDSGTAPFERAADAGYSLLLALGAQLKGAPTADQPALQRRSVDAAVRFADGFPADARGAAVLVNASETLFALGQGARAESGNADGEQAVALARRALERQPAPEPALARVAWTVIAHQAFEAGRFGEAEQAYAEVLARTEPTHARRSEWIERQAAAIYRQGELAREAGDTRGAVQHFARVGGVAGLAATSALRAGAGFDRAAGLIALKDWAGASDALEAFRREHPAHPLQAEVPARLALAYLEQGRHSPAALEFEKVAAAASDPALARAALWQAAELHDKAVGDEALVLPAAPVRRAAAATTRPARTSRSAAPAAPPPAAWPPRRATAIATWERYLATWPAPLEPAMEARWRLAELSRGDAARHSGWLRALQQADTAGGEARTPRTRTLGGQATLALAAPLEEAYRAVRLVEPLQRQLAAKKARMDELLKAYATASEAGVAEVTTAATYRTAALYADFGEALLKSERPKRLSKLEREQYDVLLEEQAFPFEERAIELHEANARRTTQGLYDAAVKSSLEALAKLKPVRYAKAERSDAAYATTLAPLQQAVAEARARNQEPAPALLNALGVALRRDGRFADAQLAYEEALAQDPRATAPLLNLAILHDLYLGDAARAEPLYRQWADQVPAEATQVNRWLAEIRTRKPATAAAASAATAATAVDAPKETQ